MAIRLRLEHLEDRALPAGHTLATATPLMFDANLRAQASDKVLAPNEFHLLSVELSAADRLPVQLEGKPPEAPPPPGWDPSWPLPTTPAGVFDGVVRMFDSSGQPISLGFGIPGPVTGLTIPVPTAGTYYLGVSSSGNV